MKLSTQDRSTLIRRAASLPTGNVERRAIIAGLRQADAPERVTIYYTGAMGNIAKMEGALTDMSYNGVAGTVDYIPKGGRRERTIMTYYSPFILVVKG